jgi:hypothetical protein
VNYSTHYDRLIARARSRTLAGYCERHHVLPRCMGGDDAPGNIVELTPEEHYVAHQLLVKIHPDIGGLAYAAMAMSKHCTGNKPYGWLRRRHGLAIKGVPLPPEHRAKIALAKRGQKLSTETKAKIAATKFGKKNGPRSLATRAKMSAAQLGNTHGLGKKQSPETIAKRVASLRATLCSRTLTAEQRERMAAAQRGKRASAEAREKMSRARLGVPLGPLSPEHLANLSRSRGGRPFVDQHGNRHETLRGAARVLELHASHISAVLRGKRGSTGGYVFRFFEGSA